jgi:transcription antitermination factor NusG
MLADTALNVVRRTNGVADAVRVGVAARRHMMLADTALNVVRRTNGVADAVRVGVANGAPMAWCWPAA